MEQINKIKRFNKGIDVNYIKKEKSGKEISIYFTGGVSEEYPKHSFQSFGSSVIRALDYGPKGPRFKYRLYQH